MRIQLVLVVSILATGCGAESLDAPAVTPAEVSAGARPERVIMTVSGATTRDAPPPRAPTGATAMQRTAPSSIIVLQTTKLDHYSEVVGVIDVHEPMGGDAAALQKLRERASEMGADAVVGVEFHHGEAEGEPTHLSGMAVRFVPPPRLPMHGRS